MFRFIMRFFLSPKVGDEKDLAPEELPYLPRQAILDERVEAFDKWHEEHMRHLEYFGSEENIEDLMEWSHSKAHEHSTRPPWEDDYDDDIGEPGFPQATSEPVDRSALPETRADQ